ncbi:phage antirepressor KilAC domain-containing protein [Pseudomonas asiatica]|uniref:phage antirepressor KilAC domain-containing protein n=1 Tax=Pseudomonas asiatica TaxID=2219225 RepID=UPI0037C732D3
MEMQNNATRNHNPIATVSPMNPVGFCDIGAHPVTMSSKEIASLTGKPLSNVHRDIRSLLKHLAEKDDSVLNHVEQVTDSRGYTLEFRLRRREVDLLLTGYSISLRAVVYDRWRALETEKKRGTLTVPNSLSGAVNLVCMLAYQVEALEQQVAENAEKVDFYNDMADTTQLFGVGTVAKTLDTGPVRFFSYMRDHKILKSNRYRLNEPYQKHLEAGRFKVKWAYYKNEATGELEYQPTPFFTGKGVIWIEQFIAEHGRDGL